MQVSLLAKRWFGGAAVCRQPHNRIQLLQVLPFISVSQLVSQLLRYNAASLFLSCTMVPAEYVILDLSCSLLMMFVAVPAQVKMAEDIDFKYPTRKACAWEISNFCSNVPHGHARVMRCLQVRLFG